MASELKYLIVGTGGVGASIGAFLHINGCDVTFISRGAALASMKERGMLFRSDIKGDWLLPVEAVSEEEYSGKADVIFVAVKGYSIESVADVIRRAAHSSTIVIPVLNVYGTGGRIARLAEGVNVLDGCIYIVGFKSGTGAYTQMGGIFHIVFGVPAGRTASPELLAAVCSDLSDSGIKVTLSDDIDRDTFIKWSFISAMALTGAYHDIPMGPIQHPGEARELFTALSSESAAIGRKLGIDFGCDLVEHHLEVMDSLDPESTASLQKDLKAGHESEIQGQLFDMVELAGKLGVETPAYDRVAEKFSALRAKA